MTYLTNIAVPLVIAVIGGLFLLNRQGGRLFEVFIDGIKDGLNVVVKLLPTLIALMVCVSMFSASGALGLLVGLLSPVLTFLGVPTETAPLILTRPISGGAATAIAAQLFGEHGPDSRAGLVASVVMGSSDTLIYIFAVYFGCAGVKKTRWAMPAALTGQIFCILSAVFLVDWMIIGR